ncbi:MAG: carbohydrate porin [Proteobacteria bacterium]|nr:carbohydrate porin [Pseudomonadota bacterium]
MSRSDEDASTFDISEASLDYILQKVSEEPKSFEFHGYLRAGFGVNGKGGRQVGFQAPGAIRKYRLGNEADMYCTLAFVNNWLNPADDGFHVKTLVRFALETPQFFTFDAVGLEALEIALREAYGQAGHVIKSAPEIKFWAGQRFYRRHDVHMIDWFFFDMSGYGGGVEDIDLGFGKLSVAYIGTSLLPNGLNNSEEIGLFAKNNLDIRLNVQALRGELVLWLNPSRIQGGDVDIVNEMGETIGTSSFGSANGMAAGLVHTRPKFFGGYNKVSVQYGVSAGANLSASMFNFVSRDMGDSDLTVRNPNLSDSWQLRITENAVIQPAENFSIGGVIVAQITDNGLSSDSQLRWYSIGARPIWHATKYLALALEAGVDYIDDQPNARSGYLAKFTVAPQVVTGKRFFARPNIRTYFTAAKWSDDFKGILGGDAHSDDTYGLAMGVQVENWW